MASEEETLEAGTDEACLAGLGLVFDAKIPTSLWEVVIKHLEGRQEYFYWVHVNEKLEIEEASSNWQREIYNRRLGSDSTFWGTLSPAAVADLTNRQNNGVLVDREAELVHSVAGGSRVVAYRFFPVENGWLLFGRDESRQIEIVSQMAVLIEDIESEMQKERDLAARLRVLLANDDLTGLANRRHFREKLNAAWDSFVATERNFSVISLDLDHFKAINDRFGHPVGDDVLKNVSKALVAMVRSGDTVARYGGEEFLILVLGADLDGARSLAERIRRRIELISLPNLGEYVTASLGVVAAVPNSTKSPDDLLAKADIALYSAKENGRNRVEIGSDS